VPQIALTWLAKHYGLISEDNLDRRGRGLRHWGASDYRPSIDGLRDEDRGESGG
jgi:hypothetical protein